MENGGELLSTTLSLMSILFLHIMSGNQHISVNRTPVFSHPRCGVFCFNVTTAYLLSALHRQNQSEVLHGVPQVLGTDKNLMVSSQDFTKNDQQQWNQDAQSLQLHWCVLLSTVMLKERLHHMWTNFKFMCSTLWGATVAFRIYGSAFRDELQKHHTINIMEDSEHDSACCWHTPKHCRLRRSFAMGLQRHSLVVRIKMEFPAIIYSLLVAQVWNFSQWSGNVQGVECMMSGTPIYIWNEGIK